MSTVLRPYQHQLISDVRGAWSQGAQNVAGTLATGGGKTLVFGTALKEFPGASIAIAHRRELVGQMSVTLARQEVYHRIIAPDSVIRDAITRHVQETGRSYHDTNAPVATAGAHTLVNRNLDGWAPRVGLWVVDECHHLLADNLWGRAVAMFPNARGLGVTATLLRADGKGLGRHADGLFDTAVHGPGMRWLIDNGFLTDYRIFAPRSDLDLAHVAISSATGDYVKPALTEAVKRSRVTGDIVESYLRIAPGKLGVTFCVSVELSSETAARYRAAGVPAEVVSADTPDLVRAEIIRRFTRREILQLVNVDLFGEGFDLPAIEVVSMGRPTESYGLYAQQFGRTLRTMTGKVTATIIDHVGNVLRHGLPDAPRVYSLDRRERRARTTSESEIPLRACPECTAVYERFRSSCPYCGHTPVPLSRAAPEHVDGDLTELDPAFLARLRAAGDLMQGPKIPYNASPVIAASVHKNHREWISAQSDLRAAIAWWAGWQRSQGRTDSEGYRRFYHAFGTDVATAQTLRRAEAEGLTERVRTTLTNAGVNYGR